MSTRLFNRHGFDRTSMEDVAAAIGVTTTAIYRHFRNKQQILDTATLWITEQIHERIMRSWYTAEDDEQRLDGLVAATVEVALDSPDFMGLLDRELTSTSPEVRSRTLQLRRDHLTRWTSALMGVLPELSQDMAQLRVELVLGMITTFCTIHRELPAEAAATATAMAKAALLLPLEAPTRVRR